MTEANPAVDNIIKPDTPELFAVPSAARGLSEKISKEMRERYIHTETYGIQAGVYITKKLKSLLTENKVDLDSLNNETLLKFVQEKNLKVAYYAGGIGHGIAGNPTEFKRATGTVDMSIQNTGDLNNESILQKAYAKTHKYEPLNSAAAFLGENFDLIFTSEPPPGKKGLLSSPAADAAARRVILSEIQNAGVTPEVFLWSNNGFKFFRETLGAFSAIRDDISWLVKYAPEGKTLTPETDIQTIQGLLTKYDTNLHPNKGEKPEPKFIGNRYEEQILPIFSGAKEALEYLHLYRDVHITTGGAPEGRESLTFPFNLGGSTAKDTIMQSLLPIQQAALAWFGNSDQNQLINFVFRTGSFLPNTSWSLLLSRLAEMSRAYTPPTKEFEKNTLSVSLARNLMRSVRGDGITTYLVSPGVGEVVADFKSKVPEIFSALYQDSFLCLSGNPAAIYKNSEGKTISMPSEHGLIKEKGIIELVAAFRAAHRLKLLHPITEPKENETPIEAHAFLSRLVAAKAKAEIFPMKASSYRALVGLDFSALKELVRKFQSNSLTDQQQSKDVQTLIDLVKQKRLGVQKITLTPVQDIDPDVGFLFNDTWSEAPNVKLEKVENPLD